VGQHAPHQSRARWWLKTALIEGQRLTAQVEVPTRVLLASAHHGRRSAPLLAGDQRAGCSPSPELVRGYLFGGHHVRELRSAKHRRPNGRREVPPWLLRNACKMLARARYLAIPRDLLIEEFGRPVRKGERTPLRLGRGRVIAARTMTTDWSSSARRQPRAGRSKHVWHVRPACWVSVQEML